MKFLQTIARTISPWLNRRYVKILVLEQNALRFSLSAYRSAEANGEARIFTQVLPYVDGKIRRLVRAHAADEERHIQRFDECLQLAGGRKDFPASLDAIPMINQAAGDLFSADPDSPLALGRAYLLLYALERRMVERLGLLEQNLQDAYPAIAQILRSIARDEWRHIGYCEAISRALLQDEDLWQKEKEKIVALEARVYPVFMLRILRHMLRHELRTLHPVESLCWKALAWLGERFLRELPVKLPEAA